MMESTHLSEVMSNQFARKGDKRVVQEETKVVQKESKSLLGFTVRLFIGGACPLSLVMSSGVASLSSVVLLLGRVELPGLGRGYRDLAFPGVTQSIVRLWDVSPGCFLRFMETLENLVSLRVK